MTWLFLTSAIAVGYLTGALVLSAARCVLDQSLKERMRIAAEKAYAGTVLKPWEINRPPGGRNAP